MIQTQIPSTAALVTDPAEIAEILRSVGRADLVESTGSMFVDVADGDYAFVAVCPSFPTPAAPLIEVLVGCFALAA